MKVTLTAVFALLVLVGCGVRVLPEQAMQQVDPSVDFTQVKNDPERYAGTTLLLGGRIISNRSTQDGSLLEVLSYRVDRSGHPLEIDEEGGRFLVRSDRFLDPEVYERGSLVTTTATVLGRGTSTVNDIDYSFPLLRLVAAHIWRTDTYLDPGRYPYHPYGFTHPYRRFYRPFGYDPFWHDPFWGPRYPWYGYDPFWP